ncbi:NAD(P)-binding protein [Sarocladium strictum]
MKYQNMLFTVTGGLSGLGAGTVEHLARLGAHVAVVDLNLPGELQDTDKIRHYKADVSNQKDVASVVASIVEWANEANLRIEGVITCAGYLGPAKILSKSNKPMSLDNFKKVIDVGVIGTVDIIRQLLPRMVAQTADADGQRGVLITVSSASAYDGQEGQVAYSASKGAIASMMLPMARDLGSRGIRAVSIAPGIFDTDMVAKMPKAAQESTKRGFEYPSRGGRPEEFAALVETIVDNRMINGTVIRIDGASRMPARI